MSRPSVGNGSIHDLLNRPLLESDLAEIDANPWAHVLRRMVSEYRREGLPLVNGSLSYSNLLEGPAQMLTCHPYRLWEYVSLFRAVGSSFAGQTFLDVGGAGSPLPCLVAEKGGRVLSLERQPLLVALADHVSRARGIDLRAEVADAVNVTGWDGEFDVAMSVSVIEHVPPGERPAFIESLARMLRPGGLLYVTFDYGDYDEDSPYRGSPDDPPSRDRSLSDVAPLCAALDGAGLSFVGNDPRDLPAGILAARTAPRHQVVAHRMALTRAPFDGETPWSEVARYVGRRLGLGRRPSSRYRRHNFFRLFARKG